MSVTASRKARKAHRCDSCDALIRRGDYYLRHTEFPADDPGRARHAGHPVQSAECAHCAGRYGRHDLFPDDVVFPFPGV